MVWIDNKKSNDMVTQSRTKDCFKTCKIFDKVTKFITEAIQSWRLDLTERGKNLAEIKSREAYSREMLFHYYYS